METLNLCEILKGHEGEIFYSPAFGHVTFLEINSNEDYPITVQYHYSGVRESYTKDGKLTTCPNSKCTLFPSKDQRDWNKWVEEQKHKVPKTWSELVKSGKAREYSLNLYDSQGNICWVEDTPIEKSSLALLKIHQLIEVGYGGNVLCNKEKHWEGGIIGYTISILPSSKKYLDGYEIIPIKYTNNVVSPIMFKTREYAEEFIKYEENCSLLRIFNMVAYPRDIK